MYSVRSKDSPKTQKRALSPKPNSMLVSKIYNNPITSSVTGYYSYAKNSNRVFNYGFGLAESTLKWMSSPMVRRLDDYASWVEGEVSKLTNTLYIQPKTVDDIYLNVRFLLDIVSNLASNTVSFSKDKLSHFSARDLITESMRLRGKYNNRDAVIGLLRVDLVREIHNMSDLIVQYMDEIRAKAVDEEHVVIGRLVLTLEQGLQHLLSALPEAKAKIEEAKEEIIEKVKEVKEEILEKVKVPAIQITPPHDSPSKRRRNSSRRMSPAPIDTQSIGSVRQAIAQREQSAVPAEAKKQSRWVVVEDEDSEQDSEDNSSDLKETIEIESAPMEQEPVQQSEISGNVTVVSQEELKETQAQVEQPAPVEMKAQKSTKKRIDVNNAKDFPALPHVEHTKRTWADIAHEQEEAWMPLPAGNVQIVDLSALDHESRFRSQAPAAAYKAPSQEEKREDKEEVQEDFPALSGDKEADQSESESDNKETYLDALKYGSQSKGGNEWHVYHSRPVIGHMHRVPNVSSSFHPAQLTHTPFIETVSTDNHFAALEKLNNQEVRENVEAAEFEESARIAHEAYIHRRGVWHHALPANQDKKHHFGHHVTVHQPKAIETLAGSNPFDALREEIEVEEQHQEEEKRAVSEHVIDSIAHERHSARLRLKATKKLEEAERRRRVAEITQARVEYAESRAADKKAVIELEEAERKVRLAEYIGKLRANRAQENVQREIDNVDERVQRVSRAAESQQNRELSSQLEEEERARILSEAKVCQETSSLERAAVLSQVRRLEEEERSSRMKDLAVKNSGELNLPMVGSPMM